MSNIQVVVRCRGRNQQEIKAKSPIVLELADDTYSIKEPYITLSNTMDYANANKTFTTGSSSNTFLDACKKTYKFDQIYGSQADQSLIFANVASPLLCDFLNGINVTILAYGQTGTGKTYTMCGTSNPNSLDTVDLPEVAGIIPRLLCALFEKLDSTTNSDFAVKVSYLEIYNEELIDLLQQHNKKLRILEKNISGKASPNHKAIAVQNLTECCVSSHHEGMEILRAGLKRRKTASTNMNETSSRSHTIFGIQLYQKDPTNDTVYKISKMNLVDLAGSENISRSGSLAKEAGGINQSLLTLGRVINTLNNNNKSESKHIPYRESKLTYLLQDSLGGNTKTTLIATVSPAQINAMETCSTLDYAAKAKNIKNLPRTGLDSEVLLKRTLVKDMAKEISQLNLDLNAARNKNGIYMEKEKYSKLQEEHESLYTQLKERDLEIKSLSVKCDLLANLNTEQKLQTEKSVLVIKELKEKVETLEKQHKETVTANENRRIEIESLSRQLSTTKEESEHTVSSVNSIIANYLQASLRILEETMQAQIDSGISVNLNELYNKFQSELHQYMEKSKMSPNFSILSIQSSLDSLLHLQKQMFNNVEKVITNIGIANKKLFDQIKTSGLLQVEEAICTKQTSTIKNDIGCLTESLKSALSKEIEQSMQNILEKTSAVIHQEMSKEISALLTIETDWKKQVQDSLLPSSSLLKENSCEKKVNRNETTQPNNQLRRRASSLSPKKTKIPIMQRSSTSLLEDQNKRRKVCIQ
ncbi:CIN8 [Candida oxycetoniae]|uniref:Kinesin-like protein n=1 Tax=Candida oxycetoniae TaxID=497107 RepID=A0AAI9SZF1_9ASCO|nr:CIN8 [Candida oxycetoniae]KAI3406058.2 CIN8 [Candida oxycetoniae]